MTKIIKNGIEIVSLGDDGRGVGRLRMRMPLTAADIRPDTNLAERLRAAGSASLFFNFANNQQKNDNFNYESVGDILPQDGDYITVPFRAISKRLIPGHWLDFSKDNVLEESTEMLRGATVYPNHDMFDINNALGVVSNVSWDAEGSQSEGVPGINAEYKIDALMNPRIARLLLMKPPAIHSTSMTILFEFEYSHPEIALESKWKFFDLLGEEVEGSIVRLIVSKILEYWEASLVFQGADRLAKRRDEDDEVDFSDLSVTTGEAAGEDPPANSNEEKTMKLTADQKTKLGIEFDGEDVPETEIFKAGESLAEKLAGVDQVNIEQLTKRAEAGDALVEEKRTEVTRLAKLAELGAEEGQLDVVVSDAINDASVERLQQLGTYYGKKAAERFPEDRRSSLEDSDTVDNAGGSKKTQKPTPRVGLH